MSEVVHHRLDFEDLCRQEAQKHGIIFSPKCVLLLKKGEVEEYIIPDLLYQKHDLRIAIEIDRTCHEGACAARDRARRKWALEELGFMVVTFDREFVEVDEATKCIEAFTQAIAGGGGEDALAEKKESDSIPKNNEAVPSETTTEFDLQETGEVQRDVPLTEQSLKKIQKADDIDMISTEINVTKNAPEISFLSPESIGATITIESLQQTTKNTPEQDVSSSLSTIQLSGEAMAKASEIAETQRSSLESAEKQEPILTAISQEDQKNLASTRNDTPQGALPEWEEIPKNSEPEEKSAHGSQKIESSKEKDDLSPQVDVLFIHPENAREVRFQKKSVLQKVFPAFMGLIVGSVCTFSLQTFFDAEQEQDVFAANASAVEVQDTAEADKISPETATSKVLFTFPQTPVPGIDRAGILWSEQEDSSAQIQLPRNAILHEYKGIYFVACPEGREVSYNGQSCVRIEQE